MAEAFVRKYAGDRFETHSAGLEPKGLKPLAVKVMSEIGIDISAHASKGVDAYVGKVLFQYLITVCDDADKTVRRSGPASTRGCIGGFKILPLLKARKRKNWQSSAKSAI